MDTAKAVLKGHLQVETLTLISTCQSFDTDKTAHGHRIPHRRAWVHVLAPLPTQFPPDAHTGRQQVTPRHPRGRPGLRSPLLASALAPP